MARTRAAERPDGNLAAGRLDDSPRASGRADTSAGAATSGPAPSAAGQRPGPGPAALRFDHIFEAYAPYVLGLLRRLGVGEADVEDVAQEVFTAVHTQLPSFEGRSKLKTWICGIALRRAADYRRKAYRRRETIDSDPDGIAAAMQLSAVQSSQEVLLLQRALDELDDKLRSVFVLYEVEELPMADVVAIVGCKLYTGYTRLRTARLRIRESFERAGYRREDV